MAQSFIADGDDVGDRRVELGTRFDRLDERLVDRLRQPILHHRLVEDVAAEKAREAGVSVKLSGGV